MSTNDPSDDSVAPIPRPNRDGATAAPGPPDGKSVPPPAPLLETTEAVPVSGTIAQTPTVAQQAIRLLGPGDLPERVLPSVPGYTLEAEIGAGGMGVVYRARELTFNRDVAIKLLQERFAEDGLAVQRFLEEARITGQLQHPAIPPVHHLGTLPDGRPFLVMKLIKGNTLATLLESQPAGDPDALAGNRRRFVAVFAQVCQAVAYAHDRKVIHRDLKPSNVMVGGFGEVQLMDWGLAKVLTGRPERPPESAGARTEIRGGRAGDSATQPGLVLGTPAFMAPEQARGEVENINERTDVFGLGAVLCTILTGRSAYAGPNALNVQVQAMLGETDEALARLDGCGADPDLVGLCKRCLAPRREDRPRDAGEVARAVSEHLAAAEERARQAELNRVRAEGARARVEAEAREARKRRRVQWALGGAVLLLLAAGGLGSGFAALWRNAERAKGTAESAKNRADLAKNDAVRAQDEALQARDQLAAEKKLSEAARDDALRQKGLADSSRDEAFRQKGFAEQAQKDVERERQKLEVVEYGRTMQVAYQEWRDHNVPATVALLAGTRPELRGWEYSYVNYLCHTDLLTLRGHTDHVLAVALNKDGTRIVTGGSDHTAKVWNAHTGKELLTLTGHTNTISSVAFSMDGAHTVTGSWDKTAKVWDAKTGKVLLTLEGHTGKVESASFSPDQTRIVTSSEDRTAKVWDAKTGKVLLTLAGHMGPVQAVAFSPDGSRIVTGSMDRTVRVWNATTGKGQFFLTGHTNRVTAVAFSPDGARIVTGGWDNTARVWEVRSHKELFTLEGHTGVVRSVVFSPDGERIVTGSWDDTARIWEVPSAKPEGGAATAKERLVLKGHTDRVESAVFTPDGSRVVTGSWDKTVKVWEVPSARPEGVATASKELLALEGSNATVSSAPFSPGGERVVTAHHDKTARVWDATTGRVLLTLTGHTDRVESASFSADGARIATGSWDKTAKVWDAKTGKVLLTLEGHTGKVESASFSPDGSRIITSSDDKTAKVWDAKTGKVLFTLDRHASAVNSAAFSPNGSRIVTSGADNTVRVWNAETGKELFLAKGTVGRVTSAAFSPDGTRIVTNGVVVRVRDTTTGRVLLALKGHTSTVWSAAFGPDGTRIVTGSADKTEKVWDAVTGAELLTLRGHQGTVMAVAFSSDGARLITCDSFGTTKVWDAGPRDRAVRPKEPAPPPNEVKRSGRAP
jgi:WD40 repeat protein